MPLLGCLIKHSLSETDMGKHLLAKSQEYKLSGIENHDEQAVKDLMASTLDAMEDIYRKLGTKEQLEKDELKEQKSEEKEAPKSEVKEEKKEEPEEKDKKEKKEPTKYQQDIKTITKKYSVYPGTNIPVPGFNEGTSEKIYRAIRRIKNPSMQAEEIGKIIREARVAAEIKLNKPQQPKAETKNDGGNRVGGEVVGNAKKILGVDDVLGKRVQNIIGKAKDFDEFEKMVNSDKELVDHLNSKFPGLQDMSKLGTLEGEKIGTERGAIGVNKQQLMSLLGATMYDKPLAQVAVKELLQNSFDAVKARQNLTNNKNAGKVEISINRDNRTISIKDDGIGMTPDIVKNAFLSIGGTNKEGLSAGERSGGLGLAKVQFLMGSQSVKVVTVRDGVKTSIDATNVQLYNDDFDIRTEQTNEPNGSFVEVKIPESYTTLDGTKKDIHFPGRWNGWNDFEILKKPLIGDADISVNLTHEGKKSTETIPIGKNSTEETLPPQFTKVKFDWGEADVYMSVNKKDRPQHQVLSSGIYQFNHSFRLKDYDDIPYDIVVNIKPSVGSTAEQYPFNNQREGFKNTIKKDIDALSSYLRKYALGEAEKEAVDVFSDIKQLPKVDPNKILTPSEREKLYADVENKQRRISKGEQSVEEAAKNIYINRKGEVRNQENDSLLASAEKDYEQSFTAQKEIEDVAPVNTEFFNPQFPQFHNNTNVDYFKTPGAVEFITDFGNTVLQLVRFAGDNFGYEYQKLRSDAEQKFFAGVSIDKSYGGVHIRKIINAIFVNPLAFDPKNLEEAVGVSLHITLHEINHTTASGEGANFTTDLATLYGKIYSTGKYGLFEGLFRSVYNKHFDTFQNLKNEYDKSTTRNLSKSFEGNQIQEPDKGDIQGNEGNVPSGQDAGKGNKGDRKDTETDKSGDVISSKLSESGKVLRPDLRSKLKEFWDANSKKQSLKQQPKADGGNSGEGATSTLRNESGEVRPTDADIMAVEGFETILKATSDWEGNPRKDLNVSANRTIGEVIKELQAAGVEISKDAMAALENKNEVDEGVDTNNNTYLFDLMTNAEASQEQRGMAAALIAAHRLAVGRTWLATAYRETGKSISVISSNNPASHIMSVNDRSKMMTINGHKMGERLHEQSGEKKFFNWLEMALYEEVIHLATFKVATEEEIAQIGKELSPRERQVVESIYGSKLNDWNAGIEYIRQIMQHNLFGTTTELTKLRGDGGRMGGATKEFFARMLKFIKDIFSKQSFPNETIARDVVKRMEDYLGITNPNDRFRTPKQVLAEQPKLTVHEMIEGEKPVMMFSDRNRQYLIQERKIQSGKAWFEMEQAPDGTYVPVNYGPHEIPGLLGYTFTEAQQALMGRGGTGVAGTSENVAGASEGFGPQFDINSVFSQELTDKAISYAKNYTRDGAGIERLPKEAEEGRRISGPINAEATIITSAINRAGQAFGRKAQERREFAVEQSFQAAKDYVNKGGDPSTLTPHAAVQVASAAIKAGTKTTPEREEALARYKKYVDEVDSIGVLLQALPHKIQQAQEDALIQYAKENGHLIQDADFNNNPPDRVGAEAQVYFQKPVGFVTKLKKPAGLIGDWLSLFDSTALHNHIHDTPYTIKGFRLEEKVGDEDYPNLLSVVLHQKFVIDDLRNSVTPIERNEFMVSSGFVHIAGTFYQKKELKVSDLHQENVLRDDTGSIRIIDSVIRYTGEVNEDYLDRFEGNVAGASDGFGPEMTEEERRRLEVELAADIVREFGNTSAIKGDPIRDFTFPQDEGDLIMQDSLMTMLQRDPQYAAITANWVRPKYMMGLAQHEMENLVGDLFAKYEFDDVISYIIESLKDETIKPGVRAELIKVIMARILHTHPDIVNVIREKIYPELATAVSIPLLALKNQEQVQKKGWKPKRKPKPKPIDVAELFSHDKQSQEMVQILKSVEGGEEIVDQMIDLNNRMRADGVTTEEEETLALMAEEANEERNLMRKRAESTKELVEHMENKVQKFSEEEKKGAGGRADFLKYQLMTRRNLKSIEITFQKIKDTISKIAEQC